MLPTNFAQLSVIGANAVEKDFREASLRAGAEAYHVTRMYTQLLNTKVKAHASGRPGPRAPTGDYRRSITWEVERHADESVGIVGTTRPQGRRLELGYEGVDSLGRHYHQPPFPHFRPALSEVEVLYVAAMGGMVRRIL